MPEGWNLLVGLLIIVGIPALYYWITWDSWLPKDHKDKKK